MKKGLCFFLVILLIFSTTGCISKKQDIQEPVTFYYRKDNMEYGKADGVIGKETREAKGKDHKELLALYLKGPETYTLYRPFPINTALIDLELRDNTAYILLSDTFSSLTGLELTIACACLTMTACSITGAQQASISCSANALLDGYPSITMSLDDLLLMDDSSIIIEPD